MSGWTLFFTVVGITYLVGKLLEIVEHIGG